MIKSFAHKGLKDFFESGSKKGIQPGHAQKLSRILDRTHTWLIIWIITEKERTMYMTRKPTHPGTVFLEDVMKPLHLSVTDAARMLGVTRKALSEFVNEKTSLSPEMALRISKATNTSVESWMNMQQKLTLWNARKHEPKNVIPFPLKRVKEV